MRAEVHAVFRFGESVVHVARAPLAAIRSRGARALSAPHLPALPDGLVAVDARGALTVLGEPLAIGARRVVALAPIDVELSHEDAGAPAGDVVLEPVPGASRPVLSQGLSLAFHGALLAALAVFAVAPDEAELRADRMELATRLDARLALGVADEDALGALAASQRDEAERHDEKISPPRPEGVAGRATSAPPHHQGSVRVGRALSGAAEPARADDAIAVARSFGMISLIDGLGATDPQHAFGTGLGAPPDTAFLGGGDDPWALDLAGSSGLGLRGIGEGGGGRGEGIGLGSLAARLGPDGSAFDQMDVRGVGLSSGHGTIGGSHRSRGGRCGCGGGAVVSGRLPADAIQRVVRQHFGEFRACWSPNQLAQTSVGGRVSVAFVIGLDGAVSSSAIVETSPGLPDGTRSCVARVFGGLSFPAPEGGIVRVTYPIVFEP